jgi:hypothetical protein
VRRTLSGTLKQIAYYRLGRNRYAGELLRSALVDYARGRLGGVPADFEHRLGKPAAAATNLRPINLATLQPRRILIYPSISKDGIRGAVSAIRQAAPGARIDLLLEDNRLHGLDDLKVDQVLACPRSGLAKLRCMLALRKNGYELGVLQSQKYFEFDITTRLATFEDGQFFEIQRSSLAIELGRLLTSILVGEVLSVVLLPSFLRQVSRPQQ